MFTKVCKTTNISSLSLLIGLLQYLLEVLFCGKEIGKEQDYQLVNTFLMQIQQI